MKPCRYRSCAVDANVAVLVAAAIGVVGTVLAGLLPGRAQRGEAVRAARRDAYRDVLRAAHELRRWAENTHPVIGDGPEPDWPSTDVLVNAAVLIALYGSTDVRAKFDAFKKSVGGFQLAAGDMTHELKHPSQQLAVARQEIATRRQALASALSDVAEAMRRDAVETGQLRFGRLLSRRKADDS